MGIFRGQPGRIVDDNTRIAELESPIKKIVASDGRVHVSKSGVDSIASGNTSVTVAHRCEDTPAPQQITITPTNNPTNDPGNWWVDTITDETFDVNVRSDPGASGFDFAWKVAQI